MRSTALYFGSFNPVHYGHLAIAQYALTLPEIDEVWLVLSPQSPLKSENLLWDEQKRLQLLQTALIAIENIRICTIELEMSRPSYTIDTLNSLQMQYPEKTFVILMGADNLEHFEQWKSYKTILDTYRIYVYPRAGVVQNTLFEHPHICYLADAPLLPVSSTELRASIEN
ncbi:putative nicotinate-nucleotide adenylyltransferase [Bacteroidia bacterium]|nr:putative nicotinate-nucleotide adenylyltransferase [Bacteroidia bacterium]